MAVEVFVGGGITVSCDVCTCMMGWLCSNLLILFSAFFTLDSHTSNVSWLDVQKDLQSRVFYLLGITISGAFLYFGILWMSGFRPKDFYHTRIG